jgi:cellulose synthase/poly-beta-1,6-N-acetylglucosamine synthase-like glycosyltransferase
MPAGPPERIGERLLREGVINEQELEQALEVQGQTGGRLGEILLAGGMITEGPLARNLAEQWGLPYMEHPPVRVRPDLLDPETAWELGVVPVQHGLQVGIATAEQLDFEQRHRLEREAGDVPIFVTTVQQVKRLLTQAYGEEGATRAREELRQAHPEHSASKVLVFPQVVALVLLSLGVAAFVVLSPAIAVPAIMALALTYYAINSLYKMKLAFNSLAGSGDIPAGDWEIAMLDERSLPRYTILVPLYKEANVVRLLTDNLRRLDYPVSKLEVLLLCEADDTDTISALEESDLPGNYHVVHVPTGEPRTKPRACNYGLLLARGEFCVIYDAEDRPEPDQLKKAVIGFRKGPPGLACIQAKLNYFNSRQNLLTRWFAAEYAFWFDLVLPGLHHSQHPIPLGGTSNHFTVSVLRELCAWDPFNMTEDADLGIRLWERGWKTGMIDSITLEEANSRLGNWVRQRSRWIKGYLQTWLVHMRHPLRLVRRIGLGPFLSLQFTVGGIIVTLLNPIFWTLTAVVLIADPGWVHSLLPGVLFWIALAELLIGNFMHLYLFLVGSARRGFWDLIPTLLAAPLYWLLMSISGWKGALQLVTKPFYWEKTEHGLVDPADYLGTDKMGAWAAR